MCTIERTTSGPSPRTVRSAMLALFAVLGVTAASGQNLVQNGSFEDPPVPGWGVGISAGSGALPGWQVAGGGLDLVHTAWDAHDGLNSISMNWVAPSTITQTVATTPGAIHELSFAMAAEICGGPALREINVRWNGAVLGHVTFDYTGQGPTAMGWEEHAFVVIGTGSDVLSFESLTPANFGPALDAVSLVEVAPLVYCTAKVNSQGCTPAMAFSGLPGASFAAPFHITASGVINNKNGILFYGLSGRHDIPFQGGILCVKPPTRRTPVQSSGGNPPPADCSGTFLFDFNGWLQAGSDPNLAPGLRVNGQYWYRDPQSPSTTGLTDAIEFLIGP